MNKTASTHETRIGRHLRDTWNLQEAEGTPNRVLENVDIPFKRRQERVVPPGEGRHGAVDKDHIQIQSRNEARVGRHHGDICNLNAAPLDISSVRRKTYKFNIVLLLAG